MDGILYLQVIDPQKASYGIDNYKFAVVQISQTTMRSIIGKMELDKTFEERETVNGSIVEAVDKAFHAENTGRQVIVEQFVSGREFSVGIYRQGKELVVLPATEVVTTREFFDFEAKYVPGLTQEITPADLSPEQRTRVERLVKAIYVRLNCKGMVRVDYFLENGTDRFYFIEINTIPGQTAQSFIPQQVRAAGMKESDFYALLVEEALTVK